MPDVVIYTQPFCGYCARATALLEQKGVSYREISAPQGSPERQRVNQMSGRTSVPQVFVGDQLIGGSDDLAALERTGKLDLLLAEG